MMEDGGNFFSYVTCFADDLDATFLLNQIFHGSTFSTIRDMQVDPPHPSPIHQVKVVHNLAWAPGRVGEASKMLLLTDRSMAWEWGPNTCLINMGFMNFSQVELKSESVFFGEVKESRIHLQEENHTQHFDFPKKNWLVVN